MIPVPAGLLSTERDAALAECKHVMEQTIGLAICCSSFGVPVRPQVRTS